MRKILIVEDSESTRAQVRELFVREKFEVLEAVDGEDGLNVLRANKDVSLIFLDISMPRMDGLTMCRMMRKDKDLLQPPIIVLTSETRPSYTSQAKELGTIAWVLKPYNEEVLLKVVNKILGK